MRNNARSCCGEVMSFSSCRLWWGVPRVAFVTFAMTRKEREEDYILLRDNYISSVSVESAVANGDKGGLYRNILPFGAAKMSLSFYENVNYAV